MKSHILFLTVVMSFIGANDAAYAQVDDMTADAQIGNIEATEVAPAEVVSAIGVVKEATVRHRLTGAQRKQLYVDGLVTDSNGQIWRVKVIPGLTRIKGDVQEGFHDAKYSLKDAGGNLHDAAYYIGRTGEDLKMYTRPGFRETLKNATRGIWNFAKEHYTSFGRDVKESFTKTLGEVPGAVRDDYKSYRAKMDDAGTNQETGWRAVELWHTLGFGAHFIYDTMLEWPVEMAFRLTGAGIEGAVATGGAITVPMVGGIILLNPPAKVAGHTLAAVVNVAQALVWDTAIKTVGVNVGLQAALVPGSLLVWQQPAWLMTAFDNEPTKETFWTEKATQEDDGRFIPVDPNAPPTPPQPHQPVVYTLTEAVIQNAIVMAIQEQQTADTEAPIQSEITALKKELAEVKAKLQERDDKIRELEDKLRSTPESAAAIAASQTARHADVREIPADLKEQLENDAKIDALVSQLAKNMGTTLSPAARAEIVKRARNYIAAIMN